MENNYTDKLPTEQANTSDNISDQDGNNSENKSIAKKQESNFSNHDASNHNASDDDASDAMPINNDHKDNNYNSNNHNSNSDKNSDKNGDKNGDGVTQDHQNDQSKNEKNNSSFSREGDLLSRIDSLEREKNDLEASIQEKSMRFAAEIKNLQNRQAREIAEMRVYGSSNLLKKIIGVLDNFDRAVDSTNDKDNEFYKGIVMIQKSLHDILKEGGAQVINPIGQVFDPMQHESISHIASDEHEDGTVINVLQVGYSIGERLLRPAMVQIVKN